MASTISPEENRISVYTVKKAVRALQKWRKLHPKGAPNPDKEYDDSDTQDFIFLLLTLKKIPPENLSKTPHKIPLPNPLRTNHQLGKLCLIIDDRPIKSRDRITAEAALRRIKSDEIPITRVLKLSKLKSECGSLDGRRELYRSFDIFLADRRVIPLLPGILGKQFYKKKRKIPVPLDLRGKVGWREQIELALSSAIVCFGKGTCSFAKVGVCGGGMSSDEVVENVVAAVNGVSEIVPKKWSGVRALHLKLSDSLALPVYDAMAGVKEGEETKGSH